MCVDDLVCQGAEPLFFLDYIAVGKLDPDHIEQLVEGVAEGCRQAGCALIGGEMAEHPGAMEPGEFDLVGFAVGRGRARPADHRRARPRRATCSSGCRRPACARNGYSLARRVLLDVAGRSLDDPAYDGAHHTLADELLEPSVIYAPAVLALQRRGRRARRRPHHRRRPRRQPAPRAARRRRRRGRHRGRGRRRGSSPRSSGSATISDDEMRKVFNLGIGMVVVVARRRACPSALDVLRIATATGRARSARSSAATATFGSRSPDAQRRGLGVSRSSRLAPRARAARRAAHPVGVRAAGEPGRHREQPQPEVGERCAACGPRTTTHSTSTVPELSRPGRERAPPGPALATGAQRVRRRRHRCSRTGPACPAGRATGDGSGAAPSVAGLIARPVLAPVAGTPRRCGTGARARGPSGPGRAPRPP